MKNIEKYRDKLLDRVNVCSWYDHFNPNGADCVQDCKECEERFVEWLFEDCEKQVLDEKEKEYLSSVIKPFRKNVQYISKIEKGYEDDVCFIAIFLNGSERIHLPYFNIKSGMYAGMQPFVKYL
ncbi:MAG: hypothetical protein MSJ41_08495 [Erysipelotrichaceae bacterium]|nr:hypothetical protein [Erysipelotrichaceae bacterium]